MQKTDNHGSIKAKVSGDLKFVHLATHSYTSTAITKCRDVYDSGVTSKILSGVRPVTQLPWLTNWRMGRSPLSVPPVPIQDKTSLSGGRTLALRRESIRFTSMDPNEWSAQMALLPISGH